MSVSRRFTPEERIGLRLSLDPKFQDASDTELESLLQSTLSGLTEEEAEGFWSTIKDIGGQALKVGAKALPGLAKGAVTGLVTGGLPGALIGAAAGGVGSVLASPQPPVSPTPQIPTTGPTALQPAAKVLGKGPSSTQLLKLLKNPLLLQSLSALTLRASGRKAIPVGDTPVATGDFMNLLGVLASAAAKEAAEDYAMNLDESQSAFGSLDPAIPEHRAEALMNLLDRAEQFLKAKARDEVDLDQLEDNILMLELR